MFIFENITLTEITMKATMLRSTALAVLLTAGMAFISCKEKENEAAADGDTTTTEMTEHGTDTEDGDTIVTETDSITANNAEDKSVSGGEQVP
jgi:hypothetical protein